MQVDGSACKSSSSQSTPFQPTSINADPQANAVRTNPWCAGTRPPGYLPEATNLAHTRCTMPITPVGIRYISPINKMP